VSKQLSTHYTFTIERAYQASPERVFQAFANPAWKAQWYHGGDDCEITENEFDFRVDGREIVNGTWKNGKTSALKCHYNDIVENERIVYTYAMRVDGELISFSLSTVEFVGKGGETLLRYTEQLTCVDGHDDINGENRKHGMTWAFDRIENVFKAAA
jgi:uncharacterized protein YndB with AHSA1/START domain